MIFPLWDKELFFTINGMHTYSVDVVMFYVSKTYTWAPFFLYLAYFCYLKKVLSFQFILSIIILIIITDQGSVFLKNHFQRLRPCQDPEMAAMVHIVGAHCGGLYGFVSSHAANCTGLALFISLILKNSKLFVAFIAWIFLVSYSRIYLGVHFPLDIIGGIILGCFAAVLMFVLLNKMKSFKMVS